MNLNAIKWIGHASFVMKTGGKTIYIDPFRLSSAKGHADAILITHPHFDHLSVDDIKKIAGPDTQIYVPKDSVGKIGIGKIVGVEPNKEYQLSGRISMQTIPAYNVNKERLDKHPLENKWVGYILKTPDMSVYHAGDTDFIDEMHKVEVDLALLPMSGTYTMDVDEAIEAAHAINAEKIAPMHYKAVLGQLNSGAAENRFRREVQNSLILKEIQDPYYSF